MQDEISQAVLANEDVVKYLRGGYGDSGAQARERINGYLDELRTTQRHKFYRALQHPLYPILRKIERKHENLHHVANAVGRHRIVYVVEPQEPLRLSGRAAGARRQRHPAAAHRRRHQPVRRTARPDPQARHRRDSDPAQHQGSGLPDHAQGLRRRDAQEARSVFLSRGRPQLQRRAEAVEDRAVQRGARRRAAQSGDHPGRGRLRPGARGSHPRAPERQEAAAAVRPRGGRDGALRGRLPLARVRHLRRADHRRRSRRRNRAATCSSWRGWSGRASARSTRCCRPRCSPRRCGRRSRGAISSRASIG